MNAFIVGSRNLLIMTLLLGGIYPAITTLIGGTFFSDHASGNLELIAQNFSQDRYFWSRPAGVSNKSGTSKDLRDSFMQRKAELGENAPKDLLYGSGSGLDPHISPAAAYFQKPRIMKARNLSEEEMNKLIALCTEERFLGFMGQARVNVLKLNKLLDQTAGK